MIGRVLADGGTVAVVFVAFSVIGCECVSTVGVMALLYAAVLLGTSWSSNSYASRFFGHKALASLGEYSLPVYMFQKVINSAYDVKRRKKGQQHMSITNGWHLDGSHIIEFFLCVWVFSAVWTHWVDQPLQKRVRKVVDFTFCDEPHKC